MKNIVEVAAKLKDGAAELSGHTDADWEVLKKVSDVTIGWGQAMADAYAGVLNDEPEGQGSVVSVSKADHAQGFRVWYENLVSGVPGETFWAETALLGMFHASTSVLNRKVVAMAAQVESVFLKNAVEAFETKQALEVYGAFQRVLSTAVGVMVDSYMDAILAGMADIGMNERLVSRIRNVAIRRMIDKAREVLPVMTWSDSLSVGLDSIDEQHKRLVGLLNALHDSGVKGEGNAAIAKILGELTSYTVEHFAHEEKLMQEHDYPDFDAHKKAHESLVGQVAKLNEEFKAGSAVLGPELFQFLRSWLNGHIRGTDKLYGPYFSERGIR